MSSNNYNKDELVPPEWLNAEYLQERLRDYEKDDKLKVNSVQFTPATMKGDHYASLMYRAIVCYTRRNAAEQQKISLIIKTMPENDGSRSDLLGESHIFETEVGMYTEVIPKFEEILGAAGDNTILGAPFIYFSFEPHKLIIFKDLVPEGYTVVRNRFLNFNELKAAYSKLAKWQAISYKISKEDPPFFDKYRYSLVSIPNILEHEFMRDGLANFIELLESIPTLRQYKPYFEAMRDDFLDKLKAIFTEYRKNPEPGTYYVLCHGDFHSKNMMFQYNTETKSVQDCMLLDFQIAYFGPMVNDIMYSTFMMMDADVDFNHFDEALYYFYTTFKETLEKIKFKGTMPKLVDLRQQLVNRRAYEFFLLFTFQPMMFATMEKVEMGSSDMVDSPECRRSLYYNKGYIAYLHKKLPQYLLNGYLEN